MDRLRARVLVDPALPSGFACLVLPGGARRRPGPPAAEPPKALAVGGALPIPVTCLGQEAAPSPAGEPEDAAALRLAPAVAEALAWTEPAILTLVRSGSLLFAGPVVAVVTDGLTRPEDDPRAPFFVELDRAARAVGAFVYLTEPGALDPGAPAASGWALTPAGWRYGRRPPPNAIVPRLRSRRTETAVADRWTAAWRARGAIVFHTRFLSKWAVYEALSDTPLSRHLPPTALLRPEAGGFPLSGALGAAEAGPPGAGEAAAGGDSGGGEAAGGEAAGGEAVSGVPPDQGDAEGDPAGAKPGGPRAAARTPPSDIGGPGRAYAEEAPAAGRPAVAWFVKPEYGSEGRGIWRLERRGDEAIAFSAHSPLLGVRVPPAALTRFLRRRKGERRYVVQPDLRLARLDGRPVDFRLLVVQEAPGTFRVVSAVARLGPPGHFLTNLAQAGTLLPAAEALRRLAEGQPVPALSAMKRLAREAARWLQRRTAEAGPLLELGVDIGLDAAGRLWIIEVNAKPSKRGPGGGGIRPSARALARAFVRWWTPAGPP
ncbi:MAG: YheC/YheD family protein [Hydrogenibacillus schlegelii]|nr:YheC/YheD family protein [Hydrogenibacillus schlegelii]